MFNYFTRQKNQKHRLKNEAPNVFLFYTNFLQDSWVCENINQEFLPTTFSILGECISKENFIKDKDENNLNPAQNIELIMNMNI